MKYVPPIGGAADDPYIDANPGIGQDGSPVPAAAIEAPQREIQNVIVEAGLTPDEEDYTQLAAAIAALIAAALPSGSFAELDAVQAWTKAQRYTPVALVDGASIAWDLDIEPMAQVTLGGNRTMAAPTHQRDGGMFVLKAIQDGTGSRSLAWNAAYDFGADGVPTLPSAAGKIAIFTFLSDGAAMRCVGRWNN